MSETKSFNVGDEVKLNYPAVGWTAMLALGMNGMRGRVEALPDDSTTRYYVKWDPSTNPNAMFEVPPYNTYELPQHLELVQAATLPATPSLGALPAQPDPQLEVAQVPAPEDVGDVDNAIQAPPSNLQVADGEPNVVVSGEPAPEPELTITADETTQAAIEAAARAADERWYRAAGKALVQVARKRKYFTTDDVWKRMPDDLQTPEPRAMGALMLQAAKQGSIVATRRTKNSKRKECHRRPVRVWQSNIYRKVMM